MTELPQLLHPGVPGVTAVHGDGDEIMDAKLLGGRSIRERLDEILVFGLACEQLSHRSADLCYKIQARVNKGARRARLVFSGICARRDMP